MYAIITYRPDSQKIKGSIKASLSDEILKSICKATTGQTKYKCIEDTQTYNKGRLVVIDYNGKRHYVSLSEESLDGRNSSIQSVPTAMNIFNEDPYANKQLCYYFLPHTGNAFTDYHIFVYRMMATTGIKFLNISTFSKKKVKPFQNIDELIYAKSQLRSSNKSNNSSFVSKTDNGVQIYAKVYGASKYESTLLAYATAHIAKHPIDLFNICEKDLQRLPESSQRVLKRLNIRFHDTSLFFDIKHQGEKDASSLRNPTYIYNLLNRLGDKKCVLCDCAVQEIIQGAHIWNIADIKKSSLSESEKFKASTSGDNGIWLCQNHHKLFDTNIIAIDNKGNLKLTKETDAKNASFIKKITTNKKLPTSLMSSRFSQFLVLRNTALTLKNYATIK